MLDVAVKRYSAGLLAVPLAASMLLAGCGGDAKPDDGVVDAEFSEVDDSKG